MEICKHSYIRQDPYFFRCVKCGDTEPAEQDEVIEALHNKIDEQQARIKALEAMWSVVFDGNEVLRYLNYEAKQRLAGKDVSDVLDAVNRAGKLRARKPAALLESEPAAHTCNASCQLPACVLRRRVEALEAEVQAYRDIRSDSTGVAGYYPNGDSALWDEFDIPEQEGE